MKATYSCDYCDFVTDNLEAMKAHEARHKETDKLVSEINAMIDKYNAEHSDSKFTLAHYRINKEHRANKSKAEKHKAEKPPVTDNLFDTLINDLTPLTVYYGIRDLL